MPAIRLEPLPFWPTLDFMDDPAFGFRGGLILTFKQAIVIGISAMLALSGAAGYGFGLYNLLPVPIMIYFAFGKHGIHSPRERLFVHVRLMIDSYKRERSKNKTHETTNKNNTPITTSSGSPIHNNNSNRK